jgi:putative ABC transport system permease protein
MIANFFKTALRTFLKNKTSSIINIVGLTIGLSVVIAIAVFIDFETSYESFHKNADQTFRLINSKTIDNQSYAGTPAPLGPFLKADIPEIKKFTRLHRTELVVKYENKKFSEKEFFLADPSFFEIFSFPLLKGNTGAALKEPNSIIVTEKCANKYFGSENPIGKTLSLDGGFDFTVTAVAKDVPENSHFHFELIIPFEHINDLAKFNYLESWGNWNYYTYVLTPPNTDIDKLKNKVANLFKTKMNNNPNVPDDLTFQPIKNIHFQFNRFNIEPAFDDKYLTIFLAVAIAVLLIACINFINLTTAHSLKRAKEVGLRKTLGANYWGLVKQFLLESILLSVIAATLSVILVELILPVVNTITEKHYAIDYTSINNYLLFFALVLLTGILAGSFPALVLSSLNPVNALKGKLNRNSKTSFRNLLVVFQFTVSVVLIISTIVISQQINFIRTTNLGFVKEQIINVSLKSRDLGMKAQTLKEEFLKNSNVVNASVNSYQPSSFNQFWGGFRWEGMSAEEKRNSMWIIMADRDFTKTYGIEMLEGADYAANIEATGERVFILNKAALNLMNWKSAAGKEITYWGSKKGKVAGVMSDFHFRSLHHLVEPCAIVFGDIGPQISLRIKTSNISSSLESLKKTWESFGSNLPFDFYFLDDDFAKLYQSETKISSVMESFTIVTVFIACIGLFGLTTFMAERRRKEFGIRKVLGASSIGVLKEFSSNYSKWVIGANIIAWPIAYFYMNEWLQDFTYRIDISWWTFILAGLISWLISLITISLHAIKAATANPVESLRYE